MVETQPTGRFAPSPTGDLHFGSLVAAVASYLNAKSRGGTWLIRVEDIDPPREVAGSADRILSALQRFGMRSDKPVLFQGQRKARHRACVEDLVKRGLAYWCGCSRKDLPPSGVYPGTCRNGIPPGKAKRAVRLQVGTEVIEFDDLVQGPVSEDLQASTGDFVIWRADGLPAYQLAVVLDDAHQGVTEIVRGHDLLESTARQIHVAQCLGLRVASYAHHPVVIAQDQQKLSKRLRSDPIDVLSRAETLTRALWFLGQPCPAGLALNEVWRWAIENWELSLVPRMAGSEAVDQPPVSR